MNTELNTHNNTRLIEVDVAKAFAIIYMVVDHVYERMSVVDRIATLPDSALRNIIEFAGGPLGAPVFIIKFLSIVAGGNPLRLRDGRSLASCNSV